MTFLDLVIAMKQRKQITLRGHTGYVCAIELEDGGGKSWNVRMSVKGETVMVWFHEDKHR